MRPEVLQVSPVLQFLLFPFLIGLTKADVCPAAVQNQGLLQASSHRGVFLCQYHIMILLWDQLVSPKLLGGAISDHPMVGGTMVGGTMVGRPMVGGPMVGSPLVGPPLHSPNGQSCGLEGDLRRHVFLFCSPCRSRLMLTGLQSAPARALMWAVTVLCLEGQPLGSAGSAPVNLVWVQKRTYFVPSPSESMKTDCGRIGR